MAENFLTRKVGPMPMWVWMGGAVLVLLIFSVYRNNQAANTANSAAASSTTDSTVPADQVPDYINQIYTTVNTPPVNVTTGAPAGTPTSTTPPVTTPTRGGSPTPPPPRRPVSAPMSYTVKHGDTLSSIASRYGTTWQALWTYNTTSGNRPASTIATLKKRGPSLLYAGETILIPQK